MAESSVQPRPRRSRAQQVEQRRRELMDAAWTLFKQDGYENISVKQIAEYAGYSNMPVYSLFGGKAELFVAVWKDRLAHLPKTSANSVRELIDAYVETITRYDEDDERTHLADLAFQLSLLARHRGDVRDELVAEHERMVAATGERLRDLSLRSGEPLAGPAQSIAIRLTAYGNAMASEALLSPRFKDPEDLRDALRRLVLA